MWTAPRAKDNMKRPPEDCLYNYPKSIDNGCKNQQAVLFKK